MCPEKKFELYNVSYVFLNESGKLKLLCKLINANVHFFAQPVLRMIIYPSCYKMIVID